LNDIPLNPGAERSPVDGLATPAPVAHELRLRFVGSGSEYFRIWIVNLLLTLVTIGLYYPFAKVRRLRYFHNATEVGGAPLSFNADPWKMFRGYLLVGVMFAAYSGAGQFSPTAGGIAFLIIAALWPALWHSSMRFRLANTGWRGLRFRYTGTRGQAYAVMAVPIGLAAVGVLAAMLLSPEAMPAPAPDAPSSPPAAPDWTDIVISLLPLALMLALTPVFLWLLKRQQHRHYALGEEQTAFDVGLGRFYGFWLRCVGVGLLVLLGFIGLGALFLWGLGASGRSPAGAPVLAGITLILAYLVVFALVGGHFTARLQNLVWNGTASHHLRFDSRLRARDLAGLWFTNTLFTVLTLGLYFPFAQVNSARLRLEAVRVHATIDPDDLVAAAGRADEAAAGDAAGDLLGFDIGL
jgi:uncharacterized membrane protein YjgN (DUF898 family)